MCTNYTLIMVFVCDHPLIQAELTKLRDINTPRPAFRHSLMNMGLYIAYEVARDVDMETIEIDTPLSKTEGVKVRCAERAVIVTILRAAIPMMEGVVSIFPMARVGIISAWRGPPPNFVVEVDYVKIPWIEEDDPLIIIDPMMATSSTMVGVMSELAKWGNPQKISIINVISSRRAVDSLERRFPKIKIYTASVDSEVNEKGYIIPGLGDAGNRSFGAPSPPLHKL